MIHRIARGTRWDNTGRHHRIRCVCGFMTEGPTRYTARAWWRHALPYDPTSTTPSRGDTSP